MKNSAYLNIGDRKDWAFVFSTPGSKEGDSKKPISGNTGNNLEILLHELDIPFKSRYEFRITNAYDQVMFKKKDGKTEANISDILQKNNLERLHAELEDVESYIIFFGNKAKSTALYLTNLKAKFIFAQHLGLQSINQIDLDLLGEKNAKNPTEVRIRSIAKLIKKQL